MKRGWIRQHHRVTAIVLEHGPDDYSAGAHFSGEMRSMQQHIASLPLAQQTADWAAQKLHAHQCDDCGVWLPKEFDD